MQLLACPWKYVNLHRRQFDGADHGIDFQQLLHEAGRVRAEHIGGTTNTTAYSQETEVTVGSTFGHLSCTTGAGTHIGPLTGVTSGHAAQNINAAISCGISVKWEASYRFTSPAGLGVSE